MYTREEIIGAYNQTIGQCAKILNNVILAKKVGGNTFKCSNRFRQFHFIY